MSEPIQMAIIGAGNIGSLYGANLARAGAKVTLVDVWAEHVEVIQRCGLVMSGLHGEFTARLAATTDVGDVPPVDVAVIAVSSHDTAAAARSAQRVLKPDGYALTLQNGMGHLEILTEELGGSRVMGGLSFHSADLRAPGEIEHTNKGPTYLGELDRRQTARLEAMRDLLARADMVPVVEPDIIATIWGKFVHNCAINALCAATGLRPGDLHTVPEVDAMQSRLIEETVALAGARGIELPEPDPTSTIKAYCREHFHRVSMAQHLARGRRTEIDALNGYVDGPYSRALTAIVKGMERALTAARQAGTVAPV